METGQYRKRPPTEAAYLSADETELNVVLSLAPRPFVTVIIATAIPAAMRPYSIAVAADSSLRKALSFPAMLRNVAGSREASVKVRTPKLGHQRRQRGALPSVPLRLIGHLPPVVGGLTKHPFGFRVFGFVGQLIALDSAGAKLVCLAHPSPHPSVK
jgi:hypothetical protein